MSRNRITAEGLSNSEVAKALRKHVEERSRVLASLSISFQQDSRVRAAWLWGSFMRGEQDDLSDLDLWLLVSDEHADDFGQYLKGYCQSAGQVVSCGENAHNAPKGGGYFGTMLTGTHGLHQLDIYWQALSIGAVPDAPVLFDRLGDPAPMAVRPISPASTPKESILDQCFGRIAFVWLMLSIAAKNLARDPSSDMALMSYPRPGFEETVLALGLQGQIGDVTWSPPCDPLEKVELLRQVALKTAVLEKACREKGLDIASEAHGCLMRYFDLVEGILLDRPA